MERQPGSLLHLAIFFRPRLGKTPFLFNTPFHGSLIPVNAHRIPQSLGTRKQSCTRSLKRDLLHPASNDSYCGFVQLGKPQHKKPPFKIPLNLDHSTHTHTSKIYPSVLMPMKQMQNGQMSRSFQLQDEVQETRCPGGSASDEAFRLKPQVLTVSTRNHICHNGLLLSKQVQNLSPKRSGKTHFQHLGRVK